MSIKMPFDSVFEKRGDDYVAKVNIRMSGITAMAGVNVGEMFGGITLRICEGHELQVKTDGETLVLLGSY